MSADSQDSSVPRSDVAVAGGQVSPDLTSDRAPGDSQGYADGGEVRPLLCDGFDAALIGTVERCGQPTLACYDVDTMVEVLIARDGMEADEAREYLEFNVIGAWMGPGTPVFLRRMAADDAVEALAQE